MEVLPKLHPQGKVETLLILGGESDSIQAEIEQIGDQVGFQSRPCLTLQDSETSHQPSAGVRDLSEEQQIEIRIDAGVIHPGENPIIPEPDLNRHIPLA